MTESKNGDERDEIRGQKWWRVQGGMGCHSPSECRFRREDRGICRRQPLKRLSSSSTVSCHSPFLRGRCIASKFTPKIHHPLADVTKENLIAKISNTYIFLILFFKKLYAPLSIPRHSRKSTAVLSSSRNVLSPRAFLYDLGRH